MDIEEDWSNIVLDLADVDPVWDQVSDSERKKVYRLYLLCLQVRMCSEVYPRVYLVHVCLGPCRRL